MILLSHTAIRLRSVFVFHTQIIIRFIYPKTCRSVVFSILVGFFALFRRNWQTFSPENNTYTKNDFFRVDGHYDLELLVKINCKVKVIDWFWLFHLLFGVRFFLPLQSTKKNENEYNIYFFYFRFIQPKISFAYARKNAPNSTKSQLKVLNFFRPFVFVGVLSFICSFADFQSKIHFIWYNIKIKVFVNFPCGFSLPLITVSGCRYE